LPLSTNSLLFNTSLLDKVKYHTNGTQLSETPLFVRQWVYRLSVLEETTWFSDRTQCDAQRRVASRATVGRKRGMGHPYIFIYCVPVLRINMTCNLLMESIECCKCLRFSLKFSSTAGNGRSTQRERHSTTANIRRNNQTCPNAMLKQTLSYEKYKYTYLWLSNH